MVILVVAIHTQPLFNCDNVYITKLFEAITRIAVPFFFIVKGYFIGNSKNNNVIKNRLVKMLKLYFIWSIIYLLLAIYYYYYNSNFIKGLVSYLIGFFFKGEHYFSWMLWYILSEIYTMAIILLFRKFDRNKLMIAMIAIGLFGCTFFDIVSCYSGSNLFLLTVKKIVIILIGNGRIFCGLVYIPTGILLANYTFTLKRSGLLFFLGFILILIVPENYATIFILISSIGFFEIFLKCKFPNNPVFKLLRTISTVMYFIHMWIFAIYSFGFYKMVHYGVDSFIFSVMLSIIIGIIFYFIKKSLALQ